MPKHQFLSTLVVALAYFLPTIQAVEYTPASWMASIPDSAKLSDISMIGTHNSLSVDYKGHRISVPSRTQYFTLPQQLEAGVRYIDVRMRHFKNELLAHHGRDYLHQNLCDTMLDLCGFLQGPQGNSETVIMRLRRERPRDRRGYNTRTWSESLDFYFKESNCSACIQSIYKPLPEPTWPTLGEVRGKVMVIEDFSAPEGPPTSYGPVWHQHNMMQIQDSWKIFTLSSRGSKLKLVQGFFKEHVNATTGNLLPSFEGKILLNHLSGASPFAWPIQVARGILGLNFRLERWLCKKAEGKRIRQLGVLVIDFVGDGNLADIVIGRNFGKIC